MMKGSEILIKELRRHGVDIVFGYPGASILSLYDELSRSDIRHILPADERGAAFMANGYARATNKVGVCIATSGPGATNLVTGIADAFSDSVPLVVITGNVSVDMLGHDGFQEVDTTGITMPITKYNYIVKDVKDLSFAVSEAFYVATSGRKGPVLIDIPANVFDESCDYVPSEITEKPQTLSICRKLPTRQNHQRVGASFDLRRRRSHCKRHEKSRYEVIPHSQSAHRRFDARRRCDGL